MLEMGRLYGDSFHVTVATKT